MSQCIYAYIIRSERDKEATKIKYPLQQIDYLFNATLLGITDLYNGMILSTLSIILTYKPMIFY